MPIIVTGRRPIDWKCRETGQLSSSCSDKKASGVLASVDPNSPLAVSVVSVSTVISIPAAKTGLVKPPIVFVSLPPTTS